MAHQAELLIEGEQPSVSAILPAYNEEAVIEPSVRHVAEVLEDVVDDFEIIVTNDGSRDHTAEVLARLQREPALRLHVVTHPQNLGYGAALASGFNAASKSLIFFTDGDKQFNVAEIVDFLPEMDAGTDLVIGWRRQRADPPLRLLNAWGWKLVIHALFGYTARDVDCAFKLFRRSVWETLAVQSRGATFSAELLIKARRRGYVVKERPVNHLPRTAGKATGARPSVIARAFVELVRLRWTLQREPVVAPQQARVGA
jgi:glycosyltransferase involved in cell wall biosynthesis